MIRYTRGNLVEASADALVNTVNEVGVMGKGIALQFRDAFPESAREYMEAAREGRVTVGKVLVTKNPSLLKPHWIFHFPTKRHWRQPSELAWIRDGLKDLARILASKRIQSIALPPLGCGNGGLEWSQVKREIEGALSGLTHVDIIVFEPTDTYQNAPKRAGVETLTPARALMAEMIRRYEILGLDCSILEVQKLAWFLSRVLERTSLPDELALQFTANKFGPYADKLRFLLDKLDGSYLHSEKRLADAKPLDTIRFEDAMAGRLRDYFASEEGALYRPALDSATAVIEGFESPYGMELLATVDWLVHEEKVAPTVAAVRDGLARWPAGRTAAIRKERLFDDRVLDLALERLAEALPQRA